MRSNASGGFLYKIVPAIQFYCRCQRLAVWADIAAPSNDFSIELNFIKLKMLTFVLEFYCP
jgi:hypothetical protein